MPLLCPRSTGAQALGGLSTFNFLNYSTDPAISALGGVNLSRLSRNAGPAVYNPSLLRPGHDQQLNAIFHDQYARTGIYDLFYVRDIPGLKTTFSSAIHYFDYGKTVETDAAGNELGIFRPHEWVIQVSAARAYGSRWHYGASLKYMQAAYGAYRSNGIATDVGIHYSDSAKGITASVLARNMGTQLRKFPGAEEEDLPLNVQAGLTYRLRGAPFSFSLSAQQLQRFNIVYHDNEPVTGGSSTPASALENAWRHFIIGTTLHLGESVDVHAGYNVLRRKELSPGPAGQGLSGFGMGVELFLGKWQVRYARSYYQPVSAINQFGIAMEMDEWF